MTKGFTKEIGFENHFFLDKNRINKIVNILLANGEKRGIQTKVDIDVERKDGSKYRTESIEEVLKDENVKGREIAKIEISLKREPTEEEKKVFNLYRNLCSVKYEIIGNEYFIRAGNDYYNSNAGYRITEDNNKELGLDLDNELRIFIERTLSSSNKGIKNILRRLDNLLPFVFIVVIGALVFKIRPEINIKLSEVKVEQFFWWTIIVSSLVWIIESIFQTLKPFSKAFKVYYPNKSVFYWGDQIEIYDKFKERNSKIFWGIVIGFIVSLLAGIVTAIIIK